MERLRSLVGQGNAAVPVVASPAIPTPRPFSTIPASQLASSTPNAAPGPFSFAFSRYMVALAFTAFLINRISHLVPPRRPFATPLSPLLKSALRMPGLVLLGRLILKLATGLEIKLNYGNGTPTSLVFTGKWDGLGNDLMWKIFSAVVVSVATDAFVRALEDNPMDRAGPSRFNLFSFAFLIYVHSEPFAVRPIELGSFFVHLLLTLSELFAIHACSAMEPLLPELRLVITGFISITGQLCTLSTLYNAIYLPTMSNGKSQSTTVMFSHFPEICLELFALATLCVRLLASVLRREPLTIESIFGTPTAYPRAWDDYGLFIIRYGTGCLQATTLSGMSNEVDPIIVKLVSRIPFFEGDDKPTFQIPYVELSSGSGSGRIGSRVATTKEAAKYRSKLEDMQENAGFGFGKEILAVDPQLREVENRSGEINRFILVIAKISAFCVWKMWSVVISGLRSVTGYKDDVSGLEKQWMARKTRDGDDRADEDFAPSTEHSDDGSWSDTDDEEVDEEAETGVDGADSALLLYSDLAKKVTRRHRTPSLAVDEEESNATDQTAILLAHLTSDNSSPLTRRRFKSIQAGYRGQQLPNRAVGGSEQQGGPSAEELRRVCVICTENERTIVTYPCRCLAICEDCRNSVAQQSSSSHLCPCCRSEVTGFSRIYIP